MKYVCFLVAAVFGLFTYWQINDATQYGNHDNWFWLLYYGFATLLTILSGTRLSVPRWLVNGFVGFSIGSCLFRLQDAVGNFDFGALGRATGIPSHMNATTQQPNEAGGLLLVAAWFIILSILSHVKVSKQVNLEVSTA